MEISNWVTEHEVLAALNVIPPNPSSYARFLEKFLNGAIPDPSMDGQRYAPLREWESWESQRIKGRHEGFVLNYLTKPPFLRLPPPSGQGWQLPPTISREESQPFRDALTSAHLRTYVDEWLDTGLRADGSEWEGQRNVTRAFYANLALWDYLQNAPPTWSPSMDSSGIQLTIAQPSGFKGVARDFFESQIVHAKRLFAGIITSNWKDRLCKCRYSRCGRYFPLPKLRKSYKRGTFCCRKHAKSAAAEASMRKSRTQGLEQLIEAAARKLLASRIAGPQWQDNSGRKRRLAEELCMVISQKKLHGYREQVEVNWVTRHQATIERKRVELSQK